MKPGPKTLFISDLHLQEKCPHITEHFLTLLQQCDQTIDALYILGDLFEAWIGDDDDTPFHRTMMTALAHATQKGLRIYIIRGNRDFLLGSTFMQQTGCQLLNDEEKIQLYGTPVLLMHGDTLCTEDKTYLTWRKIAHHALLQKLFFLSLPLSIRRFIAQKIRAKSQLHIQSIPITTMDVTQKQVEHVMEKHQVFYLIHGHTHQPHIHTFSIHNQSATRIVLGAWHEKGSLLVWYKNGEKELVTL